MVCAVWKRRDGSISFGISERYELRSTLISSNFVFYNWSQILKDKVVTAAVIDQLLHHATILEFNAPSYQMETAQKRKKNLNKRRR